MTLSKKHARAFSSLIKLLQRTKEEDLDELISYLDSLGQSPSSKKTDTKRSKTELEEFGRKLSNMETVQEARVLLNDANLIRLELERLARALVVHTLKSDKVEDIKDRLIQETVAARLNSAAIRRSDT